MTKRKFNSNDPVNDVFIVETICKKKIRSNKEPLYFIKWKDWDDKYNTWEPQSNILDKSLIETFEEEQKEKHKSKKDSSKITELKELDLEKKIIEFRRDVQMDKERIDECQNQDYDKLCNKTESRPKICLKIPKHRIHGSFGSKLSEFSPFNADLESPRKSHCGDEGWRSSSDLSPKYSSKSDSMHRYTNDVCFSDSKHKPDLFMRHCFSFADKSPKPFDHLMRKPRKLLSINEYSAKMKKHHKKSKSDRHRSERKLLEFPYKMKSMASVENKVEQKPDQKIPRPPHERPLISLENQIETWSDKSLDKNIYSESVKDVDIKPVTEKFKYHANTIVTDVTIRNLSITIREMPYEDFIDSDPSGNLMIRVPKKSDWMLRYRGNVDETDVEDTNAEDNDSTIDDIHEPETNRNSEIQENSEKKKMLLERFTECIIPGFRPPSRPRSVDSYKASMDKNYPITVRNPFSAASASPVKMSTQCQVEPSTDTPVRNKSPLHVIIDDCEEVDVVGGIESDHSFVGSLQAETVTVSTQIRQAMPVNTSPVTSIIQSLLQSYTYNRSMMLPPLQAAPWMESELPNHVYQMSQHNHTNNNSSTHGNPSAACLPSSSTESSMLKCTENACLLYRQPTGFLPDLFVNTSQDTPIDLSFK